MPGERKPRSIVNAVKIANLLRAENGLKKVSVKEKPKAVKISTAVKEFLARQALQDLFPEILSDAAFLFTEEKQARVKAEVERRIERIKNGRDPLPEVAEKPRAPRTPKAVKPAGAPPAKRGRKPKA